MCNKSNCGHDLDDSLDGLFDGPATPLEIAPRDLTPKGSLIDAPIRAVVETRAAAHGHRYEERCTHCGGSGTFVGYTGRILGSCFACKGKGILTFKSSPEAREKARNAAAAAKARVAEKAAEDASAWLAANPSEADWIADGAKRGFEFAAAMRDALLKYGHLTEKQEAAVRNATAKWLARKAEWAAAKREAAQAAINVDKLAEAFATAKANRLKYPKIRLGHFTFSLAPDTGRNAGAIYVKDGETYLGKVVDGRFFRSRDCTTGHELDIIAAAADPEKAAAAYGLQTGTCSCCGRELTNAESVGLGIGPICREKWGW